MKKDEEGVYHFVGPTFPNDCVATYEPHLRENKVPIVVDFGSSNCRLGWAGEKEPRITFRNAIAKSRKDSEILVGNTIGSIEAVRQSLKTPFDRNVITHFEAFETVMDYGFSRLGLDSNGEFLHPVCFTEGPANPNNSRCNLTELMFELYKVPSLAFGIDSLFSIQNNQHFNQDSLVISMGHQTIHIIPILDGKPCLHQARRINLGGLQLVNYMQRILQLRYPSHTNNITITRVEEMFGLTRISDDFFTDLKKWKDPNFYEKNELKIQFPFVPVSKPPPADPEVLKARRQELGRRLTEINAKKREAKLTENNAFLSHLQIVHGLKNQENKFRKSLDKLRLKDLSELESLMDKTRAWIQKAEEAKLRDAQRQEQGGQGGGEPEVKKRREDMGQTERLEFDVWIQDIQTKLQEIRERKAARAARRKQLAKRRTAASQERMRIINQLARNNKEEDTFGLNDSDWDVYKQISRDAEESDSEEETLKAQEYESVLREHNQGEDQVHRNSVEWHRIHLSTELIMVPEIIFQPSIIGLDQAGLAETIQFIFSKFSAGEVERLANNVFITGGLANIKGLKERLELELQQMLPFQATFKVRISEDPVLSSWRGASDWASKPDNISSGFMSKEEYEEKGDGYFKEHFASNIYTPTPIKIPDPTT